MSYGLRVWDAGGNLTLDVTDRITRFVTTITPGSIAPTSSVAYSVPGLVDDGTWFLVMYQNLYSTNSPSTGITLNLTITTDTITLTNSNTTTWTNGQGTVIEVIRG